MIACWRGVELVVHRQRVCSRRCRSSRTTSASARRASATACCSRRTPPVRCSAASLLERPRPVAAAARAALVLAIVWALRSLGFALSQNYPLALGLLLVARHCSTWRSLDGADAGAARTRRPSARPRDRPVTTWPAGLRAGSGLTIGLVGSLIGIHWSLGLSAAVMVLFGFRILSYLGHGKRAVVAVSAG